MTHCCGSNICWLNISAPASRKAEGEEEEPYDETEAAAEALAVTWQDKRKELNRLQKESSDKQPTGEVKRSFQIEVSNGRRKHDASVVTGPGIVIRHLLQTGSPKEVLFYLPLEQLWLNSDMVEKAKTTGSQLTASP